MITARGAAHVSDEAIFLSIKDAYSRLDRVPKPQDRPGGLRGKPVLMASLTKSGVKRRKQNICLDI